MIGCLPFYTSVKYIYNVTSFCVIQYFIRRILNVKFILILVSQSVLKMGNSWNNWRCSTSKSSCWLNWYLLDLGFLVSDFRLILYSQEHFKQRVFNHQSLWLKMLLPSVDIQCHIEWRVDSGPVTFFLWLVSLAHRSCRQTAL